MRRLTPRALNVLGGNRLSVQKLCINVPKPRHSKVKPSQRGSGGATEQSLGLGLSPSSPHSKGMLTPHSAPRRILSPPSAPGAAAQPYCLSSLLPPILLLPAEEPQSFQHLLEAMQAWHCPYTCWATLPLCHRDMLGGKVERHSCEPCTFLY